MSFGIPVRNGLGVGLMASTTLSSRGSLRAQATAQLNGLTPYSYWDFITNRALFAGADVGNVTNTPGWSFTRASTGYAETVAGTLTNFASGALRRTDKGVLIEGARTNLCLQSETFDNATWQKFGTATAPVVTANQAAAPDGTTTADQVDFAAISGASQRSILYQGISLTSGTAYVYSVWLRTISGTATVYLTASTATPLFVTPQACNVTTTWQRFTLAFSGIATAVHFITMGPDAASPSTQPTTQAAATVYAWGAQLEAAAFASSYIPTTTASATRAADVLTVTDARSAPFSIFAQFEPVGTTASLDIISYDTIVNGTGIYVSSTPAAWVRESSVTTALIFAGGAAAVGSVSRVAARFAVNNTQFANGGTLGTADTSNSPPSTTTLKFASSVFGGTQSVYLRRIAIFNSALSDANLQTVTT